MGESGGEDCSDVVDFLIGLGIPDGALGLLACVTLTAG